MNYLRLINVDHPLFQNEAVDLVTLQMNYSPIQLERETAKALLDCIYSLNRQEDLALVSGYRSLEEQQQIFQNTIQSDGLEYAQKYVAIPNCSEHQSGLAIDIGEYTNNIDFIAPSLPYTPKNQLLREALVQHGFIERYAKEKEDITKISQEPWHFRYVGFPHSAIMADKNLTLEEYVEFIKNCTSEHPLTYGNIEIYYFPLGEESTEIYMPEKAVYQISGNNVDGFIVTAWRKSQ